MKISYVNIKGKEYEGLVRTNWLNVLKATNNNCHLFVKILTNGLGQFLYIYRTSMIQILQMWTIISTLLY